MNNMISNREHGKKISLIFVNYRSIFYLPSALRSFGEDEFFRREAEVIVVNHDAEERHAIEALSEQINFRYIHRENTGFAAGANAGAAMATGEVLAFLNPDIQYQAGSFEEVGRFFQEHAEVGVVGAVLVGRDGVEEAWSKGEELTLARLMRRNILPKVFFRRQEEIHWVSGGALFIRKETFLSIGGFDEGFFLYFEDMDLCLRVQQRGLSIQSLPTLRFFHHGGRSFVSGADQKRQYFHSQLRYVRKHRPRWEYFLLACFHMVRYRFVLW
jgi:GT2 family glycosyltransferase